MRWNNSAMRWFKPYVRMSQGLWHEIKSELVCWNNEQNSLLEGIRKNVFKKRIWYDLQCKQFNSQVFDASHKYVKFFFKQNLSKLCFVLYCKNMHWHNCVKDCYIHDMKIHTKKERLVSIPRLCYSKLLICFPRYTIFGTFFSDIVA